MISKEYEAMFGKQEMSIIIESTDPIVKDVYEPSQKYTMVVNKDEEQESKFEDSFDLGLNAY